jgi:hypothetical protein
MLISVVIRRAAEMGLDSVLHATYLYNAARHCSCLQLLTFLIDMGNELSSMVQKVSAYQYLFNADC